MVSCDIKVYEDVTQSQYMRNYIIILQQHSNYSHQTTCMDRHGSFVYKINNRIL